MTPIFKPAAYITWNDLGRCPYPFGTRECREWSAKEDNRLLLLALDRYAEHLIKGVKPCHALTDPIPQ